MIATVSMTRPMGKGPLLLKYNPRSRREHRDRRESPYVALDDHLSCCRLVLFEGISLDVGGVRSGIVPRLKQQNMVRVVFRDRNTKLTEARLFHRCSA